MLYDRYGSNPNPDELDQHDLDDLIAALLELRGQLRKLQWYGEVNRRGFIKITKKLDKKVTTACAQQRYLVSRVDPKPFATNAALQQDMNAVNSCLSRLGDVRPQDDAGSARSSMSTLARPLALMKLNLPLELLQSIDLAIGKDDLGKLGTALEEAQEFGREDGEPFQRLLLNYFQRAIAARAKKCMVILLGKLSSLDEPDDINKRNFLHRIIIAVGRTRSTKANIPMDGTSPELEAMNTIAPAEAPMLELPSYALKEIDSSRLAGGSDDTAEIIEFLLGKLRETQRPAIRSQDAFGRMPLHYAAKYGFVRVCELLMQKMKEWKMIALTDDVDSRLWLDTEGNSPLGLAVLGGWRTTVETLLETYRSNDTPSSSTELWSKTSALLALAAKANFFNIVRLLLKHGADPVYQDETGDTALHIAARFGHVECAQTLIECSHDLNLEIKEATYGWTPLLLASVEGQLPVVELLVEAGADVEAVDSSGWSAKEHAALRGHMDVAAILAKHANDSLSQTLSSGDLSSSLDRTASLDDRYSKSTNKENIPSKMPAPIKSFGHRYLTNESMVLVSLGSMDTKKMFKPVDLDNIPYAEAHATQLDTALSVVISAQGATGEPTTIDLPVQETICTEPIVFMTKDISKVKIFFDIVPTYAGDDQPIGRGVAMLAAVKASLGFKKTSLQGDLSVPIVAAKTLDFIGTVNFNFLVATPFSNPNMSISENKMYWKRVSGPMVIGHRGMGKNIAAKKSLQLGENTMQSFITAANLGASYVEFDVQLTKDHVPVIYHDFLVSETGIDAPVHALTLEQFLHVNESATPRPSRPGSPSRSHVRGPLNSVHDARVHRSRANSLGASSEHPASGASERMKHTRDMKTKGFKGNSRGAFIQEPFTTLEEMLRKLPSHISFNIEMKYPMLFETELEDMDAYAVELNSFVDTVLTMVFDLGGKRDIIFSSFHPDICLLLSLKQPSIPVLFLTDAGVATVGDIRASSLQEAIRFASRWNLLGIVSAAEPFVMCPRLVRVVKESGLVCVSYGTLNNEPENVQKQVEQGIDAVIVDSVLAIRKGLTEGGKDGAKGVEKEKENGTGNGVPKGGEMVVAPGEEQSTVNGKAAHADEKAEP